MSSDRRHKGTYVPIARDLRPQVVDGHGRDHGNVTYHSELRRNSGSPTKAATGRHALLVQAGVCAGRTVGLLLRRQLHLRRSRVGSCATLPDGRSFRVFRESSRDGEPGQTQVTLAVWFHLRGIPAGSRVRRFLFERLCLVNTILFAGFDGYRVKLWMVAPDSSDYAGLYTWRSAEEAEVYARYITGVLTPLSVAGSVGYEILPDPVLEHLLQPEDTRSTR